MKPFYLKIVLYIWILLVTLFLYYYPLNFLSSIVLYFVIPAVPLSIRHKRYIKHLAIFSLLFTIPLVIIIDYVMHATNGWYNSTILPFRLFGYVPIEDFFWAFSWVYFILIYYKTFYDVRLKESARVKYRFAVLVKGLSTILITFFAVYIFNKSLLHVDFFYFKLGIALAIIPITFVMGKYKRLFSKTLHAGIFFSIISFAYEIIALKNGYWVFPNAEQHIGMVYISSIAFPLEEFVFWILLGSIAILSFYEFFYDDRR